MSIKLEWTGGISCAPKEQENTQKAPGIHFLPAQGSGPLLVSPFRGSSQFWGGGSQPSSGAGIGPASPVKGAAQAEKPLRQAGEKPRRACDHTPPIRKMSLLSRAAPLWHSSHPPGPRRSQSQPCQEIQCRGGPPSLSLCGSLKTTTREASKAKDCLASDLPSLGGGDDKEGGGRTTIGFPGQSIGCCG